MPDAPGSDALYDEMSMEPSCSTCGGEGYAECEDVNSSEGCWTHDNCNGYGFCPNCRGSGLAKDQWYW